MHKDIKKVVLAYSGGLDTSIILRWLIETYDCEVVAYVADLGQGEELEEARQKGLDTGASQVIVDDLKEEFVRDYVFPAFRAGAIYETQYLLGTSLARPVIAKGQVAAARQTGADSVSHGATGKGNDQVRFELGYQALAPDLAIIAPWREWDMNSREALMAYAKKHGIPVPVTKAKPYSSDRNILHISFEGGILEDPWASPPEDMFVLSVSPQNAPDKPEDIVLEFDKGDAVALDGEKLSPATLLARLNQLGGKHGIGRVDMVENRYVGMKSRGVYETPGGTILQGRPIWPWRPCAWTARCCASATTCCPTTATSFTMATGSARRWSCCRGIMDKAQEPVCGEVALQLYKGNITVLGRRSPNSLYRPDIATFEADTVYDQADATGFIRLNAPASAHPPRPGAGKERLTVLCRFSEREQRQKALGRPLWRGPTMSSWSASTPPSGWTSRLYLQDVRGSQAHAAMLARQGILSQADAEKIIAGLEQVRGEIEAGQMEWSDSLEDIHTHVEMRLKEIIGEAAGRLHTARSRNDQVATDLRLWVMDAGRETGQRRCRTSSGPWWRPGRASTSGTIMPGYTHLQRAQPVLLAHHLLAYVEMAWRDRARLADCLGRAAVLPLGAAALAGTSFALDPASVADELGFTARCLTTPWTR